MARETIGVDIQEGKIISVLCNFITGDLALDDTGENAGHGTKVSFFKGNKNSG